ncbi:MAG: putative toxin-antitoxin system toxin component, PIN family [bacterium]
MPEIVVDTNVLIAALKSRRGASFRLLSMIGQGKFNINLSVPLLLEYEAVAKELIGGTALTAEDIDDILNYICSVSKWRKIFYLWRPFLKDPKDDMVLELAVTSQCDMIITYNEKDFRNVEQYFGIRVLTPKELLLEIGEVS